VEIRVDGEAHLLEEGDLEVVQEASGDLVVKGEGRITVALDPSLDDELRAEGLARELVNRIQRLRKDSGLEITDRIDLLVGGADGLLSAARAHEGFITGETLAVSMAFEDPGESGDFPYTREVDLDGIPARIALRPASA
jgi:isoleucyl-tRNA synthetase